jgi:hypothetical protein
VYFQAGGADRAAVKAVRLKDATGEVVASGPVLRAGEQRLFGCFRNQPDSLVATVPVSGTVLAGWVASGYRVEVWAGNVWWPVTLGGSTCASIE